MPESLGRVEGNYKPIIPWGRRILVKPTITPDYKGTIIIPDAAKSVRPTTGTIIAMGTDFPEDYPLKEGDLIIYSIYSGVECSFDDGKRVIILDVDNGLLGIINSEVKLDAEQPIS